MSILQADLNMSCDPDNDSEDENFFSKKIECDLTLPAPENKQELEARLQPLLGRSIGELALLSGAALPNSNVWNKGFSGQVIELFLGADAQNLSLPDFTKLDLELKTLPVGINLTPVESTFICAIELKGESFLPFEQSPLYHKLSNILFVLLLAPKGFPMAERRILGYFFFQPTPEQLNTIKADYQDFADLVCSGQSDLINGYMGNIIQMRPKALNGGSLVQTRDSEGALVYTRPRGFYLRRSFTDMLCQKFLDEQQICKQDIEFFQKRLALTS